jgi:cytochrome c oxidase subunit 4
MLKSTKPNYLLVFVGLVILTAIEVGITYLPVPRAPILIPLALAKASLVALFYMHLKSDKSKFAIIFAMGLFVGIGFILALIALYNPK